MCHFLLFTNLQTNSAHRRFVDFSMLEVLCDLRTTKCVTSVFLGTNTFLIRATTFRVYVYVEHPLWCNAEMYIDAYNAYRN